MHVTAELVRSVLRWAISIVAREEATGRGFPGPRLSQFSLGNMMSRTDPETTVAIAREIARIERAEETDVYIDALVACIRANWGAPVKTRSRRTGAEDTVMYASKMLTALRQFGDSRERDLVETCCSLKTWKQAEEVMKGRTWQSIRDDFEKIACRFYLKESMTVCKTAEYITQLSKR